MGLLTEEAQAQPQDTPQAQPGGESLSEIEKQQVDRAVMQASKYVLETENATRIVEMAKATSPAEAITKNAIPLIRTIWEAANSAGQKLSETVVAVVGFNVANVMASVLVLGGVIKKEQIEQVAKEAFRAGIDEHNGTVQQGGGQQQQSAPQQPQAQMMTKPGV